MATENMDIPSDESPSPADIPQSAPISANQVMNNASGFVYKVDDMKRLHRFLCLGSEGGSFYIGEKELGIENIQTIQKLVDDGKGEEVVAEVVNFSVEGRAAKQNPIIFALAFCARQDKHKAVKRLAYEALPKVCRIPTHLFNFVTYCEKLSAGTGWGRAHRRAISNWYLQHAENPMQLAVHVTKYKNRNGWTHKDLLRLAHPKPEKDGVAAVVKYIIKGIDVSKEFFLKKDVVDENLKKVLDYLQATEDIKKKTDVTEVVQMINEFKLVREHIPTNMLNEQLVWKALLQKMPLTAMIRNLSKMTAINLLVAGSAEAKLVCDKLGDLEVLKAAKIHPMTVLLAHCTYKQGKGDKGKLEWVPNEAILNALDSAFYSAFKFVEPTNKRYLLALDVSGSMSWGGCNGSSMITPRVASAALSMVTARTEKICDFVGFCDTLMDIPISVDMDLKQVVSIVDGMPMGGTDCAQPMIWAKQNNKKYDVFIIYTDCETWAGQIHPSEALRQYREQSGILDAKLIVSAMTSNGFTLADPEDPNMFDMAGFDANGPEVMKNFILGHI